MSKRQREALTYLIEVLGLFLFCLVIDMTGLATPILDAGV